MKKKLLFFLILIPFLMCSQVSKTVVLEWSDTYYKDIDSVLYKFPFFKGNSYSADLEKKSISFSEVFKTSGFVNSNSLRISNIQYETISETELGDLNKNEIPTELSPKIKSFQARDEIYTVFSFNPIVKQGTTFKKVISLAYSFQNGNSTTNRNNVSISVIQNSVLASGTWHRFYVKKSGVYKITKSFLQGLGFNTNVDPRTIKIYGNGGRMLPLLNSTPYPIDLEENAIQFIGEGDGVFNDSDYILFYAEGTDTWNDESLTSVNLFSDRTFYYITSGGSGKRISENTQPTAPPDMVFTQYNTRVVHEKDTVNVAKLGRRWFGEQFNIQNSQDFQLSIPNIDVSTPVSVKINLRLKVCKYLLLKRV